MLPLLVLKRGAAQQQQAGSQFCLRFASMLQHGHTFSSLHHSVQRSSLVSRILCSSSSSSRSFHTSWSSQAGAQKQVPSWVHSESVSFTGVVTELKGPNASVVRMKVTDESWKAIKSRFLSKELPTLKTKDDKWMARRKDNEQGMVLTVKSMPFSSKVGHSYSVSGTFHWDDKYSGGLQVVCRSHQILTGVVSKEAVMHTLQAVPKIGKVMATKLWDLLGPETLDVLNAPDAHKRLQQAGWGTKNQCAYLMSLWNKGKEESKQGDFLLNLNLHPQDCAALKDKYGEDCEAMLRADPYLTLLRVPSINLTLKLADGVASSLKVLDSHVKFGSSETRSSSIGAAEGQQVVLSSSPSRGAVAMLEALLSQANSSGNTFERWSHLEKKALQHLADANALAAGHMGPSSQSSLASSADKKEATSGEEAHTLVPPSSNKPQLWASILMGLRRITMEVHTANPLEPPTSLRQPRIAESDRTIPATILNGSSKSFAPHSIVYLDVLHRAEMEVSQRLGEMLSSRSTQAASGAPDALLAEVLQSCPLLTPLQRQAVELASHKPAMLLTGAAGCGKTYVTQAIVNMWLHQDKKVKLCAPTGRASQRLQEAVRKQQGLGDKDSQLVASTIHRMLGYNSMGREEKLQQQQQQQAEAEGAQLAGSPQNPEDPDSTTPVSTSSGSTLLLQDAFMYNKNRRLDADAVLVDEASMLDVQLMAALLRALPDDCQLVLVGDPNQLPPVGPGSVLHDCVSSGAFAQVHLDEIFRQAAESSIVRSAHEIMHGRTPTAKLPSHSLQEVCEALRTAPSIKSGPAGSSVASSQAAVQSLQSAFGGDSIVLNMGADSSEGEVASAVGEVVEQLGQMGVRLAEDVQILSPTRKRGMQVGTEELNKRLQPIMNPRTSKAQNSPFFAVNDRVIQLTNNYERDVFNGDLGRVVPGKKGVFCTVEFAPRPGHSQPHTVEYDSQNRYELGSAWATTVHKAQGGQYPVVVMPLHQDIAASLMGRKLLYTGVTRAQHFLLLVTTPTALDRSVSSQRAEAQRNSLLAPRLLHSLLGGSGLHTGLMNGQPRPLDKDSLRYVVPVNILPFTRSSTQQPSEAAVPAAAATTTIRRMSPVAMRRRRRI